MERYEYDSVADLVSAYRSHLDYGRSEKWWSQTEFTAPTGFGTLHFQPLHVSGTPGGPVEKTWRAYIEVGRGFMEQHITDDYLPTPEEAQETIDALIQQAQPTRDSEQDALTRQLRDLAIQYDLLAGQIRQTAIDAVNAGVKKVTVADAARITRPTLDKWLRGQ